MTTPLPALTRGNACGLAVYNVGHTFPFDVCSNRHSALTCGFNLRRGIPGCMLVRLSAAFSQDRDRFDGLAGSVGHCGRDGSPAKPGAASVLQRTTRRK